MAMLELVVTMIGARITCHVEIFTLLYPPTLQPHKFFLKLKLQKVSGRLVAFRSDFGYGGKC